MMHLRIAEQSIAGDVVVNAVACQMTHVYKLLEIFNV